MSDQQQPDDPSTLVPSRKVRHRYGDVSEVTIWRWIRSPKVRFPPPDRKINNRNYWKISTLDAYDAREMGAV